MTTEPRNSELMDLIKSHIKGYAAQYELEGYSGSELGQQIYSSKIQALQRLLKEYHRTDEGNSDQEKR